MEDITGVVDISTGGGSIKCELNPGSSGNSQIRTGGGEGAGWDVYDLGVNVKADKYEKNEDGDSIYAEYTLNGGGPIITLETSDSDIQIVKMSSK